MMANSVLAPVQERGRAALERMGLPTRRQEPWRLTDLKRLECMAALPLSAHTSDGSLPFSADGVLRLVLDGQANPLEGVTLPPGISVLSEAELKQALGHTLDRCGCAEAWPVEFNHARSRQVLALRIRGSVPPLEVVLTGGDGLTATRVLLSLQAKGARASL